MMKKNKTTFVAAILFLTFSTPSFAYDEQHILLGLEYFDWNDADDSNNDSLGANFEYRSAAINPEYAFGVENFSWLAGVDITGDKDVYGYVGLLYDWNFYGDFSLVPSSAAGFYHHENGQDLGGSFAFRNSIELNYKICEKSRIGIAVNHHSNAHIYDYNPGMESAVLSYSFGF